jgi:uncharacterized protein (TIGR02246 family)
LIDLADIRAEIDAANKGFMDAFNQGDIATAIAVYSKDAIILFPRHDIMKGKPNIQSYWQGSLDSGVRDIKFETVELLEMGEDTACEIGRFTLKIQPEGRETMTHYGKYLVIWKHEDGAWKMCIHMYNPSMP